MSKKGSLPKTGPQTQSFRPADDCQLSDPGCSSPELSPSVEPRYSTRPVGYENTEPDLDVRRESLSAFQNMDPMDIEFDTKMAYQSLSDFAAPQNGRCEQVNDIYGLKPKINAEKRASTAPFRMLFCISLFISLFAFVLALGGLGLALYNFLDSETEQVPAASSESEEVTELRAQLNQSMATIDALNAVIVELSQNLSLIKEENLAAIEDVSVYISNISDAIEDLLANPPSSASPAENTTVVTPSTPVAESIELDLYVNCTSIRLALASCTIPTGLFNVVPSFASCDTRSVPWEVEDYYTMDLYCAVTNSNGESNPIITTLEVDDSNNLVKCLCYVTVSNDDFPQQVVECGLFATRCPNTYDLN